MMKKITPFVFCLFLAALLIGCGGSDENDSDYSDMSSEEMSGTIELTDDDIDKYIAALKEIRAAGAELDKRSDFVAGLTANAKFKEALNNQGLTQNRFMAIQSAMTRAWGAKMLKETAGAMDAQEKMIEQLEKTPGIKPEQIAEMRKNMQKARESAAEQVAEVPEGNIELINRRMSDIEAAMK